jgi:hypothetical protein
VFTVGCGNDDNYDNPEIVVNNIQDGSDDDTQANVKVTQNMAWEIVRTKILNNNMANINVYVSKNAIPSNTLVEAYYTTELSPAYTSWLFFIDDAPMANWGHSCRYIYVSIVDGEYDIHQNTWSPKSLESTFTLLK